MLKVREVMIKAIMKHAGLSHWDRDPVEKEVNSILKALKDNNFQIVEKAE